ncbi:MAG: ATP-binding protein, partial [Pyrinomonadaceae bacterium]
TALVELQNTITRLANVPPVYRKLIQATPHTRLRQLFDLALSHDSVIEDLLERIDGFAEIAESENEFLFSTIIVELRQGNVYRDFSQLSFGQKSGIILKMALATTEKHVVLVDQPEDHLDANSIVNMLTPTLKRLGEKRQVIIATHNSNLVLGLPARVLVLESLGQNGRIRFQGSPLGSREMVREMLDILEGGVDAFNQKIMTYEKFISRVRGSIEDMDIMTIESSFRRRTIDGLRNFLQPVVSDRSLLEYLRHELKQSDQSRVQRDISKLQQELEAVVSDSNSEARGVFEQLDKLCGRLDNNILKLKAAIEEIRLMDTQARPQVVDLYELMNELKKDYLSKLSQSRRIDIEIDPILIGQPTYLDPDHLRLVLRNLLNNALRATERGTINAMMRGNKIREAVRIDYTQSDSRRLFILFRDNGCGMSPEIREKLYVERCSDQKGRDHGLGGVIIGKLLDLNGGSIRVTRSNQTGMDQGTVQEMSLPRYVEPTEFEDTQS